MLQSPTSFFSCRGRHTLPSAQSMHCTRSVPVKGRVTASNSANVHHRRSFSSEPAKNKFNANIGAASKKWDAIVVGGGHNGLVSAAYLARGGMKNVLVLEQRHLLGGAAVTEEIFPGFKFSRCSYLQSLFRPQIIQELQLKKHGLHLLPRNPSSFTPLKDGRYLMMGPDNALNISEIAKFSKKDAEMFPKYEALISAVVDYLDPLIDQVPLDPAAENKHIQQRMEAAKNAWQIAKKTLKIAPQMPDFLEMLTAPASQILTRWFESEPLISTLATDAVIGAMVSPSTPGSSYVLLHHVMGETEGHKGVWSYVKGGMGALSNSVAGAARELGVHIETNASVSQILVENNKAVGVQLKDGTKVYGNTILSNATPHVTFEKLMQPQQLPSDFLHRIRHIDYTSPVVKINVALNSLPNFRDLPNETETVTDKATGKTVTRPMPGRQHRGTIHLVSSLKEIEDAYLDAQSGIPSRRPVIEMTLPSSLDPTLAPEGKHVCSLFVQYAPKAFRDGSTWQIKGVRENFIDSTFNVIEEFMPGWRSLVHGVDMLTPYDLEEIFGLTGGNIFHGSMSLNQLYALRPVSGWSGYRTPVSGLYLCGSGAHPGGGVMGAPGRNCSTVVLSDIKNKIV